MQKAMNISSNNLDLTEHFEQQTETLAQNTGPKPIPTPRKSETEINIYARSNDNFSLNPSPKPKLNPETRNRNKHIRAEQRQFQALLLGQLEHFRLFRRVYGHCHQGFAAFSLGIPEFRWLG